MKKILLMLAEGFEEVEALTVVDYLRRKDIICDTCSIAESKNVEGAHRISVESDKVLKDIVDIEGYDGIVLPGGLPGSTNLRDNDRVIELVKDFDKNEKLIAAICAAPIVLEKAGIIDGKNITSYPGTEGELKSGKYKEDLVVRDGHIITARGPAVAVYFALEIVDYLIGERNKEDLKKEILLDMVEN
ncbi:DJ-1 family glyoxalase III [Anaerosalibacter massiliensis]|uniref:DJ-1/PfpI family protein n=1 Tax=Anaerosalibacter massiliensis TaxID=1347392 RepID=A0A9X2MHJ7_9FIRM|nr:DJ-1 family glyoxalase III [Anaerosalibacter massiliensis]MCR2043631.1 DJ-1/PfpI family protein [Anaerosalibacter massiliensis]